MPGVPEGDEFRVRPGAGEFPRGVQRPTQVETAVDQDAGDTRQASGVAQQGTFLQPLIVEAHKLGMSTDELKNLIDKWEER